MTSTELAQVVEGSLVLDAHQTNFTSAQVAALTHIGVEDASEGDLQVFHHVCQRTGLDPFARQIYMIGRKSRIQVQGRWEDGPVKQTIQTGIDGFRLIGRRAADAAKHTVSVSAPQWAHPESGWQEIWIAGWGNPVAAKVTIMRNGEPFTAIALFDEYKQTKAGGQLTSMWAQRPAGQLAKCAEALAWRMAFPQDLSGIYTDDEMAQADSTQYVHAEVVRPGGGLQGALDSDPDPGAAPPAEPPAPSRADESEPSGSESPRMLSNRTQFGRAFYAQVSERFDNDATRLAYIGETVGRDITTTKELTEDEAKRVLDRMSEETAAANRSES